MVFSDQEALGSGCELASAEALLALDNKTKMINCSLYSILVRDLLKTCCFTMNLEVKSLQNYDFP
jgi:hypothetical protein